MDVVKTLGIVVELKEGVPVARGLKEVAGAADQAQKSTEKLSLTYRQMYSIAQAEVAALTRARQAHLDHASAIEVDRQRTEAAAAATRRLQMEIGQAEVAALERARQALATHAEALEMDRQRMDANAAAVRKMALAHGEAIAMNNALGQSAVKAGAGIGSLRGPLTSVSSNLLQLNPAVSSLTSVLGGVALGSGVMVGVLAGVAALGFAYEHLTSGARKVKEENEKLLGTLRQLADHEKYGLENAVAAANAEIEKLTKAYDDLEAKRNRSGSKTVLGGGTSGFDAQMGKIAANIAEQTRLANAGEAELARIAKEKTDREAKAAADHANATRGTFASIDAEIAKQTALKAAFGATALEMTQLGQYYDMMADVQRFAVDHSKEETAAYEAKAIALFAVRAELAQLADMAPSIERLAEAEAKMAALRMSIGQKSYSMANLSGPDGVQYASPFVGGVNGLPAPQAAPLPSFRPIDDFAAQMRAEFTQSFARIAADGTKSFSGMFEEVLRLSSKMTARMQQQGKDKGGGYQALQMGTAALGAGIAGYNIGNQSGSAAMGAIGGAASGAMLGASVAGPAGAIVGGVVGMVAGLWGAADKLKQLRKEYQKTEEKYLDSLKTYPSQYAQQFAGINKAFADLEEAARGARTSVSADARAAMENAQLQNRNSFFTDLGQQLNAVSGPAGAFANQVDAITKKYLENVETARALGATEGQLTQAEDIRRKSLEQLITSEADLASITDGLLSRFASLTGATIAGGDPFASLRKAIADALAQGLSDLAASLGQELRMDENFKAYLDGIEQTQRDAKQAAEAAQMLREAQRALLQEQLSVLQESLRKQEQTVAGLRTTVDALHKYSDSLKLSRLTPLNPRDQYLEAKRQYDQIAGLAAGGDQSAAQKLPEFANAFLEQSRNMFASSTRYVQDFQQVQTFLGALQDQYGTQLSTEEKILAELQRQTDVAQAQLDLSQSQSDFQLLEMLQAQHQVYISANGGALSQSPEAYRQRYQINEVLQSMSFGISFREYLDRIKRTQGADSYAYRNLSAGIPGFASGTDLFAGGARIVGERGPELELTGPSRIMTAQQVAMGSGDVVGELRELRREVRELVSVNRAQARELARANDSSAARARR